MSGNVPVTPWAWVEPGKLPSVTAQDAVTLLNEALAADRMAVDVLINFRINCNQQLAFHPTIQVSADNRVGLLGLINGIFGLNENTQLVCAVYEGTRLIKFALTNPQDVGLGTV